MCNGNEGWFFSEQIEAKELGSAVMDGSEVGREKTGSGDIVSLTSDNVYVSMQ